MKKELKADISQRPGKILLLSDIHANFPALQAVETAFSESRFVAIIHCGDNLVYGPFPNETINWLRQHKVINIRGNTDKKVLRLLKMKQLTKPSRPEKRIMYTWTAGVLSRSSVTYLKKLKKNNHLQISSEGGNTPAWKIGIFHGSPDDPEEFLFDTTPQSRFTELAAQYPEYNIIITGHSHTPYYRNISGTHFINPGSVGRMFDDDPRASCAVLTLTSAGISVRHYRIEYPTEETAIALREQKLPEIYAEMFRKGRKTN